MPIVGEWQRMINGKKLAAGLLSLAMLGAAAGAQVGAQEAPPATPEATEAGAEAPAAAVEPAPAESLPDAALEAPAETAAPKPKLPLVVVSWGGVYSKSQEEAIYRPFTRTTGVEVSRKVYPGGLDLIREQVASGEVVWDVVDIEPADAEQGCYEGLFERLSFILPAAPDGTAATDDFLPGTLHPCAVGSVAWSMVIAHSSAEDSDRAGDVGPTSLKDFFDLASFPGGRGLRQTPMVNLEWALLADGVDPADVYNQLRTESGIERAFAKLDTIKEAIVWWDDAGEPARLLASGEVAMTSTYNAPIFNDIAVRQQPFELIWDRQIWDIDLWAIPTAAPNREAALEFVRFATSTEPLARQTHWLPYGPLRKSAAALVDDFIYADIDIAPFLPTTANNLESALRNDALFWRDHGPTLVERFNLWLGR